MYMRAPYDCCDIYSDPKKETFLLVRCGVPWGTSFNTINKKTFIQVQRFGIRFSDQRKKT